MASWPRAAAARGLQRAGQKGRTFKIYLPRVADEAIDRSGPAAVSSLGGRETVLIVEDQTDVRGYAAAVLKTYGYRVITAENAGEALRLFEREQGVFT